VVVTSSSSFINDVIMKCYLIYVLITIFIFIASIMFYCYYEDYAFIDSLLFVLVTMTSVGEFVRLKMMVMMSVLMMLMMSLLMIMLIMMVTMMIIIMMLLLMMIMILLLVMLMLMLMLITIMMIMRLLLMMMMMMMMIDTMNYSDVGYGGAGSTPTTDISRLYTIFLMFAGK
jgi:hypothetical protein